jgi:hypothetical protein
MATKCCLGEDEIEKRWGGGEDYIYIKHITKKKIHTFNFTILKKLLFMVVHVLPLGLCGRGSFSGV